jgi:hypothetical protein
MKIDTDHVYDDAKLWNTFEKHFQYGTDNMWRPVSRMLPAFNVMHNVDRVKPWFGWKEDEKRSSWRLIILEMYCRTAEGKGHRICAHKSSYIGKMTYLLHEKDYCSLNSLDPAPPHLNKSHPANYRVRPTYEPSPN